MDDGFVKYLIVLVISFFAFITVMVYQEGRKFEAATEAGLVECVVTQGISVQRYWTKPGECPK